MFQPRIVRPKGYPTEEVWVKASAPNEFEIGVQEDKDHYTYLVLTRAEVEEFLTNLHAALLDTSF